MPYVSTNYTNNPNAPVGKWTCAPTSSLGPFDTAPSGAVTSGSNLCGQCVSYVKRVCPMLPSTMHWRKGEPAKNNASIVPGTVIATFNTMGRYEGHAAIYMSQSAAGIVVYDQFVTPPSPQPVKQRLLRWGAHGRSNNGDNFCVVE